MARVATLSVVALAGVLGMLLTAAAREPGSQDALDERPAGTLVFTFGSNRLAAIDVASGRKTVRNVPSVAACGPQMYVTGGHLIFAAVQKGRTVVFSVPVALDRRPRRLGTAHAFVPSTTPGRVWLAGVTCARSRMVGAREVTVDGVVTQESGRRIPGPWLAAAVRGGFVLQRSRYFVVWDPITGRSGRPLRLRGVVAAHGSLLAGCSAASNCTDLVIVDASTGGRVTAQVDRRYELDFGVAFSPDGSLLAAPARSNRRWSVALVDTRDGKTTVVPGLRAREYPELSWSSSSGWLFIQSAGRRMMAYRAGTSEVVRLPFQAPRGAVAYVAG